MQSRVARPAKQPGPASQESEHQWQGPSNITTFVRCLRLLDLDQLPDWPGITENVFTSKTAQQNLQARVKAAEWSLYRLSELYDPKETQKKLRPFFPPLAPLQSLNLRAALYRFLTELKKNGVLGRDAVLRKTMLDECKGDKFEEVISTLALVVLKKVYPSRHPDLSLHHIGGLPKEHLIPVILAYRHSLQQSLRRRQAISEQAENYAKRLAAEQIDLEKRQHEARQGFQQVDEDDLAQFSTMVKNMWIGDERWSEILLKGRTNCGRSLLQESFVESWAKSLDDCPRLELKAASLATELDGRIAEQEERLKKWKTFHASLKNAQAAKQQDSQPNKPPGKHFSLQFDKHKELRLESQNLQEPGTERLEPYHTSILKNMQDEIASLKASWKASDINEKALPTVRDNFVPSFPAEISDKWSKQISGGNLQGSRPPPGNFASSANAAASDALSDDTLETDTESEGKAHNLMIMPSSPPVASTEDTPRDLVANVEKDEIPAGSQDSEERSTATLLERTRASMLPFITAESPPETRVDSPDDIDEEDSQVLPPLPEMTARLGTLLERTRQSMSLLPNPPSKPKSSRQSTVEQPRSSEIFPVNQFETPGKAQVEQNGAWSLRSGSSTPRDRLFSEEADYASVFKSRPRIAVSPSLSLEMSNLGLDTILADDVGDLNPEDEEETPSRGPVREGR